MDSQKCNFESVTRVTALRCRGRGVVVKLHEVLHVVSATQEHGTSLMDGGRSDVEDTLCACGCDPSSLGAINA